MKKILLPRCLLRAAEWAPGLLLVTLLGGCRQSTPSSQQPDAYKVVRFYGEEGIGNFTKSNILYSSLSTPVTAGAFTVAPGDLVALSGIVLPWSDSLAGADHTVRFSVQQGVLWLNGAVAGLTPEADSIDGNILAHMDTASIRRLQILAVNSHWLEHQGPALQRIASLQPRLSLMVDSVGPEQLSTLLQWFDPAYLMLVLQPGQTQLLGTEPQLQHLYLLLKGDTMIIKEPLPPLPALKQLVMQSEETDSTHLAPGFLTNNPQIEKLSLTDTDQPGMGAILQPLQRPRELVLMGSAIDKKDILPFANSLERLLVDSSAWQTDMPHLRWATFSGNEGQAVLDQLASTHPNLEVLEIFEPTESININSVTSLRKLQSLVLVDADSLDLAPLKSMTHLKLLSYSSENNNDDSTLLQLKTYLPNTLVVPNEGFCLGSGWLLLLAGGLLAVIWLAGRRHASAPSAHDHAS